MLTKSTYLPWLLSTALLCLGQVILAQDFRGKVVDIETKEALIGACFSIVDTELGTCTDADGAFNLRNSPAPPFEIKLSYLGYAEQTITISDLSIAHVFEMETSQALLQEVRVVASGSRLKQTLDLTVESMGLEQIKSNAEPSFYDILANMREADMMTVSFGVKVVNTRGFNSSTPVRSLQLIDGVDNASPGLNYPLGNFMGVPELDIVGVDLVIGASSAYFGPGAFNGVVNMRTKDPFLYQGLETEVKIGQRDYVETSLRWAKGFKNKKGEDKLGVKINLSYAKVYDWVANDASPSVSSLRDSIFEDNPGGYDAVNRYGDEARGVYTSLFEQFRHPGLGTFYRTGYWEEDLADYNSNNLKAAIGIHYKFNPDWELITTTNYGSGTTVMQLDNRLSLNGVWAMQNKIEIRNKDRFFLRAFSTREDAGDTYDIVSTGQILQGRSRGDGDWTNSYKNYWFTQINDQVKQLPGFPEIGPAPDFFYDFDKAAEVIGMNADQIEAWHQQTRNAMDGGYLEPGTAEFQDLFDNITSTKVSEGGTKYVDRSSLYHLHGEYNFKPTFVDRITIGGNYRYYQPISEGTIFIDTSGTTFTTYEFGFYSGIEKKVINDKLKLNFAIRMDKHENYDYLVSPAFSASYAFNPKHAIRASVSSALRNPTLIDQYYYFKVGGAFLLGNINGYEGLVTLKSFEDYLANSLDVNILEYFDEPPIMPERSLATELSYSGIFLDDKLDIRSTLYMNRYKDFIGYKIGLDVPFFQGFPGIPRVYRFAANAKDVTYTTGFSVGMSYFVTDKLTITGNYSWNKLFQKSDDPLIPAYNTPENKVNLGFQFYDFSIGSIPHFGVGANLRWVESYTFESSPQFTGTIPAQYHLNAQVGRFFPKIKSTIKLSGSNLLDLKQNGLYGGPAVGRFVFVSWQFSLGS